MNTSHNALIIFDCDGVLVDSEGLCARVFSEQLQTIGLQYSPSWCLENFHGRSLPECFMYLEQTCGHHLPTDFKQVLDKATLEAYDRDLQAIVGITDVLQQLKNLNRPICVASNGSKAKVLKALKLTGLASYFGPHIFTIDDVQRGKPAPDLFLLAASTMGAEPHNVCVVEDSSAGIEAAIAAQMPVYLFEPEGASLSARYPHIKHVAEMQSLVKLLIAQ